MNGARVYCDAETTGTHGDRRAWEIALIGSRTGEPDRELLIYVDVRDLDLENADPKALAVGRFEERHPQRAGTLPAGALLLREADAAAIVHEWTDRAQFFGVVPSFDAETLAPALRRHGLEPSWCYVTKCLVTMAEGYLMALGSEPEQNSERISRQCGVEPPAGAERHTALGDAHWALRWHRQLHANPVSPVCAAA
ncbi:hypothetical protein [Mycobacteroides abscessus]|uniref:Exonuclease n=1 Tax=Mycobacteroides abscessus TaxID=36809 RepID=A0A0U0ZRS4_9MYCO|nr:hypothetical protein [Mycobacteroides abscessus]CPV67115.1 Uncharacterised protein [Mycobacteroides abscessus]